MLGRLVNARILLRKWYFISFFLAFGIYSGLSNAQDLIMLYDDALCNDSTLQAAKQTQLAVGEAIPQARAQLLPVINSQVTYLANHSTLDSIGSYHTEIYNINLTQPLLHFELWKKYQQATEIVQQANATYSAAEQDMMIRLAEAYFGSLQAMDNLRFATESMQTYYNLKNQTEARFKAGIIGITDYEIAKARYQNSLAVKIQAANEVNNQREKLNLITGKFIKDLAPLRNTFPLPRPDPASMEDWVLVSLVQNFQLQAARFGAAAARTNIKINSYQHLPTIDIIGQVQRSSLIADLPGPQQIDSNIGIQINYTIFQGGMISSKTREAIHNFLKTDRELETLYRTIESNTRQSYRNVFTQIEQISVLENAIQSNRKALKAAEEAFKIGTRSIVDVLNTQRDLLFSQQSHAQARYSYIIQSLKLKLYAGILCPKDLENINQWLVPAKKVEFTIIYDEPCDETPCDVKCYNTPEAAKLALLNYIPSKIEPQINNILEWGKNTLILRKMDKEILAAYSKLSN